jgi:hypothetical protein
LPAHQDFLDKGDRTHSPLYKGKVSPKCNLPYSPRDETRGKEIRGSGSVPISRRTTWKCIRLSAFREILAQILVSSAQGGGEDTDKKCGMTLPSRKDEVRV